MNIEISLLNIVDILSISTAFMLGLLFLPKSRKNRANVFLGLFLWSLCMEVLLSFLEGKEVGISYLMPIPALTIPLLFLYVLKTLNQKFKSVFSLIFVPFVLEILGVSPNSFVQYGTSLFILFYMLLLLRKNEKKLGDYYSDMENKTLLWIKTIIYIYLFFYAFWITEDLVGLKFEFIKDYFARTSNFLTLAMIYWIGYNGFSQSEIFNLSISTPAEKDPIIPLENTENEEKTTETKHEDKDLSSEIFDRLSQKIRVDKLFLQRDITIRNLSRQLEISPNELSKLIKIHTQKNFYHYVNQFRVEEFKRLLQTEKARHLSLLGLSEEAGFSSKSTFYSIFKSYEGITPKQYQDQLNKSE
ncbi:MAG: helix-turn-helix transcriptional regulator [Flavobacteriaceae bacterium]|nr:helix-turn-helix transcriptional regulator [Flavobacteriaceae bacterium]